ncbi:MAG: glycosyltransferase, partial [Sphingosinicella sp.]|uniref:glycosyltransferase n=1 Tax=Sphingosinicella sp. TaxID=1917971 RepID=UPI004037E133
ALVHAHFGPDGLLALPLARALGVPLVTTLHGYDVGRAPRDMLLSGRLSWQRYALLRRRLMREGALFIAVSDALRERALAQGFPAERTVTHRIGVDLARFRPGGAAEPGLVLHVGRLVEKKGTALLLEAFAKARAARRDASLVIIGDGPLLPALKRRAGEGARFLGAQPPEAVAQWMRRAWLLAAPSLTARDGDSEGLPTVAVEAAASGLPVVGSDHSGMPEAVRDGATGFIVPEGEAEPLASAITNLLGDAELRAWMSAAARALAEKEFDLVRQTQLLEDLYDRARGLA